MANEGGAGFGQPFKAGEPVSASLLNKVYGWLIRRMVGVPPIMVQATPTGIVISYTGNQVIKNGTGGASTTARFFNITSNLGAGNYDGVEYTSPAGTIVHSSPQLLVEINGSTMVPVNKWVIAWESESGSSTPLWFDRDQGC
jgi:hypothetical protein